MVTCDFCGVVIKYKDLDKDVDGNAVCPHCNTRADVSFCMGIMETETV